MEEKEFNVSTFVDWMLENRNEVAKAWFLDAFGGQVAREVKKVRIKTKLETRPYLFAGNEEGEVSKKLIIEVNFLDAVCQPHDNIEDEFAAAVVEIIADNINGNLENA